MYLGFGCSPLFGTKCLTHWSNLHLLFVFEIGQLCKRHRIKCVTGPVPERDYILSLWIWSLPGPVPERGHILSHMYTYTYMYILCHDKSDRLQLRATLDRSGYGIWHLTLQREKFCWLKSTLKYCKGWSSIVFLMSWGLL